eukprot:UN4849
MTMAAILNGRDEREAAAQIDQLSRQHENPTQHDSVMSLFSEEVYEKLAKRHAKDIELYYWGVQQGKALRECFKLTKQKQTDDVANSGLGSWWDAMEYGPPDDP